MKRLLLRLARQGALVAALLVSGYPLLWMAFTAVRAEGDARAAPFGLPVQPTSAGLAKVFSAGVFGRAYLNSLGVSVLSVALAVAFSSMAAYAFARYEFPGKEIAFILVLVQIMIMPDVLIVKNYQTISSLGLVDTILGIGLPYMASAFGIFLLRQAFKQVPKELVEAARVEGAGWFSVLWKVYIPLAKPTYLAYGLVSVSYHWNNFLWPVVITNSTETRPLTVGLSIFGAPESGVNFSVISAGTLLAVSPLLIAFLLFQRQFVQSFMRSGIK